MKRLFVLLLLFLPAIAVGQINITAANPVVDTVNTRFDWRTYLLDPRFESCDYPKESNLDLDFLADDIDGCVLLLRSDKGIQDTLFKGPHDFGRATRWEDQSGEDNDAFVFVNGYKPTLPYYHPARHRGLFFGDSSYLQLSFPIETHTLIMVLRYDSSELSGVSASKTILASDGASPKFYMTASGTLASTDGVDGFFTNYSINQKVTSDFAPYDSHKVLMAWAASWSGPTTQSWYIGATPSTPTVEHWQGHIFLVAAYNRVLTSAERDTIWGVLRDNYLLYNACIDTLARPANKRGRYMDTYYEGYVTSTIEDTVAVWNEYIVNVGGSSDTLRERLKLVNLEKSSPSLDSTLILSHAAVDAGDAELVTAADGSTYFKVRFAIYPTFVERFFAGKNSEMIFSDRKGKQEWHISRR